MVFLTSAMHGFSLQRPFAILISSLVAASIITPAAAQNRRVGAPDAPAVRSPALAGGSEAVVPARSAAAPDRRRIGLALSGGAARGLAHIGVIQWLDEHRIPVDMVAGTSMGALIGGAFATGMSPGEIRQFVESADWGEIVSIDSPFTVKSFRRKEDSRAFPTDLRFGLKNGINLPGGFNAGPQIDLMLDEIALPYFDLKSFDDLPTPFRSVAADLRRSEVVALDSGLLSRALRASMAIPGVFTPVRIGDRVLVDGGVLNNVPADITRRMGADIVIAIDSTRDFVAKKRTESIVTVVSDTVRALVEAGTRKALESADLLVVPDLTGIEIFDFSRALDAIKRGYDAAEQKNAALQAYAVGEEAYAAWKAERAARRRTALPVPAFIAVEGVGGREASAIIRRLRSHTGRPVDVHALARDITALTGNDRYESMSYRLTSGAQGTGLAITVRPELYGPPFMLTAIDLQNDEAMRLDATVRARVLSYDPLGSGSELRLDAEAGTRLRLGGELFQPLPGTGLFLAPRAEITSSHENAFLGEALRSEYRVGRAGAGLDVGLLSGARTEARVGLDVQRVVRRITFGTPAFPGVNGTQQFASFRLTFDAQDDAVVPSRGLYARVEARQYLKGARLESADGFGIVREDDRMRSAEIDLSLFLPMSTDGRLFIRGAAGSSFGTRTTVNAFTLGGPFRVGSVNTGEVRGSHFALGNLGYLHRVARLAEGTLGALYAGGWIDYGGAFERTGSARFRTCFNGGFILRSPLGPVLLAASVDTKGRPRVALGVGTTLHGR